jgi:acetoin:2,6-dichlorophenolindophenol oxidoreductase subunit alpha
MSTVTTDRAVQLELYRRMLAIRRFEEAAYRAYEQGEIAGTVHVSIGQEAVAVGVISALEPEDVAFSHHRAHGHALAKGVDPRKLMAELFGRSDGVSRGKGGSMHITDVDRGFLGSLAVVGGSLPVAVGAALASRLLEQDRVSVVFFGDGAINQGVLYESLNLAAIWSLPVLFVCENNGYAISVRSDYATGGEGLSERARAFGLSASTVDGQSLLAVREAASEAADRCRSGRPVLLECRTYRFMGHSRGDPPHGIYRSEEELSEWLTRDPLEVYSRDVQLSAEECSESDRAVAGLIDDALAFARSSPAPGADDVLADVWGR